MTESDATLVQTAEAFSRRFAALLPVQTTWGRPCIVLPTCRSTNDEVAAHARSGAAEGMVVASEEQTGGRGRLGRTWNAAPGESLSVSILLRPRTTPSALPPLTLLAGVCLAEAVAAEGLSPILKWPNDLLLETASGPRKAAGILTEMASERDVIRHVVVGLGLNVNRMTFPPEIADRATSLQAVSGRFHDRAALLARFLGGFESGYGRLMNGDTAGLLATWRAFAQLPRRYRVERDGVAKEGWAHDIDGDGALWLRDDHGENHRIVSGELFPL